MTTTAAPDGEYTINAAARMIAEQTGAIRREGRQANNAAQRVVQQLRIWEHRYGWPTPRRNARNGYRIFTSYDIRQIVRVCLLLQQGHDIGKLIVDGMPRWPGERPQPSMFAALVRYIDAHRRESAEHARYLRLIETALRGRSGLLQALLVEVSCLVHPTRRAAIAWMPTLIGLAAWDAVARPFPDAEELRQFIRDQIGSDAIAALLERIAKPEGTP